MPDAPFSEQDQAAYAFCVELLKREPDVSYKEARREARVGKGLSVRRQVWTAARRDLGLTQDDFIEPGPPPPRRQHGRGDERPHHGGDRHRHPGEDDAERPERDQEPRRDPPWRQPDPRQRERRDEESPGTPRPGWPSDRQRPAWATPAQQPRPESRAEPPAPPAGAPPVSGPDAPVSPRALFVSPPQNAIEFMVDYLKTKNPEASFDEVREAAEEAGHTVYPATFGRAQALAGILDDAEEDKPPRRAAPAASAAPVAPAPARSRPVTGSGDIDPVAGLESFILAWSRVQQDREVFRRCMREMLEVVQRALEEG